MKQSFWMFRASDKYGEIIEKKHLHLLEGALNDPDTSVYPSGRDEYFLSGPEESLLFRPQSSLWKLTMLLYYSMCKVVRKD